MYNNNYPFGGYPQNGFGGHGFYSQGPINGINIQFDPAYINPYNGYKQCTFVPIMDYDGTPTSIITGPSKNGMFTIRDSNTTSYNLTAEEVLDRMINTRSYLEIKDLLRQNEYSFDNSCKTAVSLSFINEDIEKFSSDYKKSLEIISKYSIIKKTDHSISFTFSNTTPEWFIKYIIDINDYIQRIK